MPVTRDEFAQRAMEFFRVQGESRPLFYDGVRDFLIVGGPGTPVSFVFLPHAMKEYDAAPEAEREKVLARRLWSAVRRVGDPPLEVLFRSVMPRIRDRAWFSAVRRQAELELGADEEAIREVTLPHHELNSELAVHLAFELPTSVMEIGPDRLAVWNVKFDELYEVAKSNLRARSTQPFELAKPGVFVSPWKDGFDASRMTLPELFANLPVKGKPVVLAPTHDVVLVTGDEDADGLMSIATWAEEAVSSQEPRAHSAITFRLEDGEWKPWMAPVDHLAYAKLKLLSLQTLASAYARQKEVLEALLNANGHPLTVATLRAFRTQSGQLFTSSAWTEGVESLLPQTDRIDFVRSMHQGQPIPSQVSSTSWDVAVAVMGEQMQRTGDVPERWRVTGFPTDEQLAQMTEQGKLPEK